MQRLAEVWHSSNYMDILQLAFPTSCYRLTVDQLRRLFSSIIRSPAPNIVEITCSDLNYNTTILIFCRYGWIWCVPVHARFGEDFLPTLKALREKGKLAFVAS